jgi:hypothetical protein
MFYYHRKSNCKILILRRKKRMKKLFMIMMVAAVVLTFGTAVYASNTVQVTLTSPAITKSGCERVGSVTFSFDSNTILTVGDWWYMDLPSGVTICRDSINYLITGGNASTITNATTINAAIFGNAADALPNIAVGALGPMTATGAPAVVAGANIAVWVSGPQNTRRVTLTVIGDAPGGTLTVAAGASDTLKIKILDGSQQAFTGLTGILLDSNANGIFNDNVATDIITAAIPAPQNTLCADAQQMSGDLMFTSFDSLSSKFTFTGDSQIAHTAAANQITLGACKGLTTGNLLIGSQSTCAADYELPAGYCVNAVGLFGNQATPYGFAGGNKFLIQGAGTFGNLGDQYRLYVYSDTPGVYFTSAPALSGYTPTGVPQPCGAGAGLLAGAAINPAWVAYNEGGTAGATLPTAGSCTVASANRVREMRSGTFTGVDTFNSIEVNTPTLCYDTSVIGTGTEVKIRLSLRLEPCGEIFTASRTIGTFVTTCPTAAGTTTLLYPFFPPMDGSIPGWWGGFMIVNGGPGTGTAVLTFTEADGDTATLTTSSIAAGGQWNAGAFSSLLSSVTPGAGNAGTFGDANFSVSALCNFSMGAGFAFTGNGTEGTGYTAYTNGGWQ